MPVRLLGVECEYAFAAFDAQGGRVPDGRALEGLMRVAKATLPHLPDHLARGIFLPNGARFYIDVGGHPEMSSPECADPAEAVRYARAGDLILAGLIHGLMQQDAEVADVFLSLCNVDYSGSHATWGFHESYLTDAAWEVLATQLIPHLVTRILYTGAGGFNNLSSGLMFLLSPRVPHLATARSGQSTYRRGIVHTKNEPLCGGGWRRLHLLCGEGLCSERASWLKLGTTALVVAMVEGGLRPGDAVQLYSPPAAMRIVARDPECRAVVRLASGARMRALDVQRHYLAQAEAHANHSFMPSWAPEVCRGWRAMLDRLEGAPDSVADVLDWAIKLTLFKEQSRRRSVAWESVPNWSWVVERLSEARADPAAELIAEEVLRPRSPISGPVESITPYLRRKGLDWDGLGPFLELRKELYEIDMRFGELGQRGIFAGLDRAAVLDHHIAGVKGVKRAVSEPPAAGRARLRGALVRRLSGQGMRYQADWSSVRDHVERRLVDLSDPFATTATWQEPLTRLRSRQSLLLPQEWLARLTQRRS